MYSLSDFYSKLIFEKYNIYSQRSMQFSTIPVNFMPIYFPNYQAFWPCQEWSYSAYFGEKQIQNRITSSNTENALDKGRSPKQNNSSFSRIPAQTKKIKKKQPKISRHLKSLKEDEEFKQKRQTGNRNICSNTLKIYLKQVRDLSSETYQNLAKIAEQNNLSYTRETFLEKMNRMFPKNKNYIVFEKIKKLCKGDKDFNKMLRISLRRFYKYEIYCLSIKSVRTTRKIRNLQIRQGKNLLQEIFS